MNYKNALAFVLSILFLLGCEATAFANHGRDSLMQFLPQKKLNLPLERKHTTSVTCLRGNTFLSSAHRKGHL